ncbi:transcriptional regulator [Amycolatopsis sp. NBRC 101858]|nr:transcriptional regulator [Amycolatopsis sp. NBRC 101858]
MSALETGHLGPDPITVAFLLGAIGMQLTTLEKLVPLAARADEPDFLDPTGHDERMLRTGFENLATEVFEWSPMLFPTALRSAGYSHAIRESGMPHPDTATRDLVPASARVSLADSPETRYTFLLGEAATRPDACPPDVLCDQIEEVAAVSKMLRISISLVPASFCPTGLVEPFTLYENHDGPFGVAVPHHRGVAYLTNKASVSDYATTATWLRSGVAAPSWP